MESIEATVALVIGIAVMFFVPALVWATVIAGLVQIVREKVRESRIITQGRRTQNAHQPAGRL